MHDNTCKTNRYNCPLSLFVTPDNNLKTQILAQAIVDDETQSLYGSFNALKKQQADRQIAKGFCNGW